MRGTPQRISIALAIGIVTATALVGCTEGAPRAVETVTVSATPRALQPGDADTSASAVCGQVSAVESITVNAAEAHDRGELSDEGYRARLDGARYVYERMSVSNGPGAAVAKLQSWLEHHPASTGVLSLDPHDAGLQEAIGAVNTACKDAGAPVGLMAQYGG